MKTGRFMLLCWLTYASAYLCRVNFSSALPALGAELSLDYNLLGAAGAAFFAVYALGQLVNGFIGDRLHPIKFILAALAGTVLCNLGVAFAHSFSAVFFMWGLNGYFQSIFWSTLVRLLALRTEKSRGAQASSTISTAMPAGYLISWCVLAQCFQDRRAALFFVVPAIAAAAMAPAWAAVLKKAAPSASPLPARPAVRQTLAAARAEGLFPIMAACVFHGLIKEGIAFWMPALVRSLFDLSGFSLALALALLPAANFAGTMLARLLLEKWKISPRRMVSRLFLWAAAVLFVMALAGNGPVLLALMAVVSCFSYCVNTILMAYVPMQFRSRNMVSSVAGLIDFSAYLGAAVSTYALGGVLSAAGFTPIPWIWLGAAGIAALVLGCAEAGRAHKRRAASF